MKRFFFMIISAQLPFLGLADPFSPLKYSPPVKMIEVDADKCPVQLFVSPSGNDSWSGRKPDPAGGEGPFATLARARDEIRKLKADGKINDGGVSVNIRGGTYSLNSTFELAAEDSGSEQAPTVYRAWNDGEVRLLGGKKLSHKDFSAVNDPETLARIDPSAKGKIVQFDIKAAGLNHAGPFPDVFSDGGGIFELFFNGKRMPLSRWPDAGYTTMKEVTAIGDSRTPGSFIYRDDRPARWDVDSGVWIKGYWRVGWENPAIKVAAIDPQNRQITFAAGINGGIGCKYKRPKGSGEEPWCAINLLEEITRPGEWSIDFRKGILYFWPPEGLEKADIIITQLDRPIVSAKDLSNTSFINLTIESSLGDGFEVANGKRILIAGCTIRNIAGRAVVLNGESCGIQSCDMYGLGRGCIIISGGNREKLIESGNYAVNNHLHDYGVLKSQYSAAIDLYSDNKNAPAVGMLFANNLIHHAPRDAVLFAGNKIVFEYNEIHRCAYDTQDTGAFYSWLDWTIRGVVIRFNYVHDTVGGVNPDDGSSGSFVYGNIFSGDRTGIWIASGPDHTILNNVFIKSEGPVFGMDDRGGGRGYASNKRLIGPVEAVNPANPPWSEEFPEMRTLLQDHPELPQRTKFIGNAIWIGKGEAVLIKMRSENTKNPALLKNEGNFVTREDPGFVDAAAGNLMLKADSPVFRNIPDFPKIPFEKIGLYIDKYRKKLPSPAEAGRLPEQNPWKPNDTDKNFGT